MSGHSKWANIRVKKGAQDAKRGKIFTRHARLIEIAARGGGDPTMNSALRTAIDNAKVDSVPNANIERAIKKGTGELKGEQMAEIVYEAYGPGGVACIIECLTDNRNRTLSNVKSIITKHGGTWAESGAVMYLFQRKGVVNAEKAGGVTDDLELALIDAGAEDIQASEDLISVTTAANAWTKVRDVLKANGAEVMEAGLKYVASQMMEVSDPEIARKVTSFIEALEEDDDVSEVHTNVEIAE